jgi:hypothetical protein
MTDEERSAYLTACTSLAAAKHQRDQIVASELDRELKKGNEVTPEQVRDRLHEHEIDSDRYDELGAVCDASQDTIWRLRASIVERAPEPTV